MSLKNRANHEIKKEKTSKHKQDLIIW